MALEINIFSLKKKNPKNIKARANRKPVLPKYLVISEDKTIKDGWLWVKERRIISPERIKPNEKIVYIVVFFNLNFSLALLYLLRLAIS